MSTTLKPLALGQKVRFRASGVVGEYAGLALAQRRDDLPIEPLAVVRLCFADAGYLQPQDSNRPQTFVSLLLVHPDNIAVED